MTKEKEQAMGQLQLLQKQIFETGIKAQALLNDIQNTTETVLSGKDFNEIDFDAVIILCDSCKDLQTSFREKADRIKLLKKTFDI